ncbi:MAG: hypothetical protein WAO67_08915 [Yoonia sp.]|jgi:hypothetical protein
MFGGEKSNMIRKENSLDIVRQLGPGGRSFPTEIQSRRHELTRELQKYLHILGPTPKRCLETFADLGLSDPEIARYFRIPIDIVTDLRRVWKIDGVM